VDGYDANPAAQSTGFFINTLDDNGIAKAINEALYVYSKKETLKQMRAAAMTKDFSWENSSNKYLKCFSEIIKRGSKW
jgi:glycogen synthase